MRLALQATFDDLDGTTDESRRRRARCERELEQNRRSFAFYRKLSSVVDDPNVKAPEVFAQESFPDPNVVAEYLDYRSESEDVATEYERVCWESPEALAEVGDCYDILVNDLPKQIASPKNCRRRLYYVAWEENVQVEQTATTDRRDSKRDSRASNVDSKEKKTPSSSAKKEDKRKFQGDSEKIIRTSKEESDVQRAMKRERSVKRRLRGYATNAIALLCVLSFGIWTLNKTRDERPSETFQLATEQADETSQTATPGSNVDDPSADKSGVASANFLDERRDDQNEVPYVADLRVGDREEPEPGANFDLAQGWDADSDAFGASNDAGLTITHVDVEPTTDAANLEKFEGESVAFSGDAGTTNARTTEQKRVRVGLRGGLDGARRRSVEIPSQNNDVFAPIQRY